MNAPHHYAGVYKIEVINVTRWLDFDLGNAVKYVLRRKHKGTPEQDLDKAIWYLNDFQQMHKVISYSQRAAREIAGFLIACEDQLDHNEQRFLKALLDGNINGMLDYAEKMKG